MQEVSGGLGVGIQQQKIPSRSRGKKQPWATEILLPSSWAGHLSWVFIPTQSFQPTTAFHHLYVGLQGYFPFPKHMGIFFKSSAFFQISPEPVDPCQQSCGSLPECEAAAGPTPGGTVSPSVYTFLRAIALGRLCEPGTQPGAVLVTLKFLLQFCQI